MGKLSQVAIAALMMFLCLSASGAEKDWTTNYGRALVAAKQQNKYMLIFFTSSDTNNIFHKLFMKNVFDTKDFEKYARKRLILLYCDIPRSKYIPSQEARITKELRKMYKVKAVPTVVLVSPKGEYVDQTRYRQGSAMDYLKFIHAIIKKHKGAAGGGSVVATKPAGTGGGTSNDSDW